MSGHLAGPWTLAAGILLLSASIVAGPAPDAAARAEVDYLLARVGHSTCRFFRNGSWYDAQLAEAHLRQKYVRLLDRGLISNTDDFIERAATRSSVSGREYAIQCGDTAPVPSAQWLREELRRYRESMRGPVMPDVRFDSNPTAGDTCGIAPTRSLSPGQTPADWWEPVNALPRDRSNHISTPTPRTSLEVEPCVM